MIETFEMEDANGITEYVRIVNGDTATIMTKENYDKQQAEAALSTPNVQVKLDKWNYRVICSNHGTYTYGADSRAVTQSL